MGNLPINNSVIDLSYFDAIDVKLCDQLQMVEIIIGADYFYSFVSGAFNHISENLRLIETTFGWTPHGVIANKRQPQESSVFLLSCVHIDDTLDVRKF